MKFNVFKGEDWLGIVIAASREEAMTAAEANPDFAGFTHVEEKAEEISPHGRP